MDEISAGPGRPRDPKVDDAILTGTVEVLTERGWAGTTIEEVASRSGVAKSSIYRRYGSKAALVAAAATRDRATRFPGFDTGSAWGDFTAFILGSLRMLGSVWKQVLPGMLAEAAADPEISTVVQEFWVWRREAVAGIVRRGVERGEIRAETDPELVLDLFDGPVLFRLLVTRAPLDGRYADRLVDEGMRIIGTSWH